MHPCTKPSVSKPANAAAAGDGVVDIIAQEASATGDGVVDIIAQEASATALALGSSADLAKVYSVQLLDRLLRRLGGAQLYFPQTASAKRREVHAWVRANWRGDNIAELAKGAGLSERRIRQLVAEKV